MPEMIPVDGETVTIFEDGDLNCTCEEPSPCEHIDAVVCTDAVRIKPEHRSTVQRLLGKQRIIEALTARLDSESNHAKRTQIEAAIARYLDDDSDG